MRLAVRTGPAAAARRCLTCGVLFVALAVGTAPARAATSSRAAASIRPAVGVSVAVLPAAGDTSGPVRIQPDGSVVGNDRTPAGPVAWLWSPLLGRRDLPRAGAASSQAAAAADSGVILGTADGRVVRWFRAGGPRPVPNTVAGLDQPQAVNNRGDALVMRPSQFIPTNVALVTLDGTRTDLLPGLGQVQAAISLNDSREAVFTAIGAGGFGSAQLWSAGTLTPLPARFVRFFPPPCVSRLTDTEYLAWSGLDTSGAPRLSAFLWHEGRSTALPEAGAAESQIACGPDAVNLRGHVVGTLQTAPGDPTRAVLWAGGDPIELGTLPGGVSGQAIAVNALDAVLAGSTAADGTVTPFLWFAGRRLALPTPAGFQRVTATGLNILGQAVGTAQRVAPDGTVITRTVVWTPDVRPAKSQTG